MRPGCPSTSDPELASALAQLALGQEVPEADVDRCGAGAGLGVRIVRKAPYPKSVMKKLGSAPDTGCVRQSVSPSQERRPAMKSTTSSGSRRRVSAEDALALWREYKATGSSRCATAWS